MSSSGAAFDKFGPDTTPARLAVEYLVLVYCRRVMVMVMVMVKGEKLANNPETCPSAGGRDNNGDSSKEDSVLPISTGWVDLLKHLFCCNVVSTSDCTAG